MSAATCGTWSFLRCKGMGLRAAVTQPRSLQPRNPEGRAGRGGRKKAAASKLAAAAKNWRGPLRDVARDELGHLEHADLGLATKDGLEGVVGIDLRADLLVLQAILLDVDPELLGELRAGQRGRANDGSEFGIGCDGFHERGVRFTSGFFSHSDGGFRVLYCDSNAFLEVKSGVCRGEF